MLSASGRLPEWTTQMQIKFMTRAIHVYVMNVFGFQIKFPFVFLHI